MTGDSLIRDELKAVERWENEGGKVPSLNRVWTSLKSFRAELNSRERHVIDRQKDNRATARTFSRFDLGRVV